MTDTAVLPVAALRIGSESLPCEQAPVFDPAHRGSVVGHVALAGPAEVDLAVRSAHHAQPGWASLSPHERAAVLGAAAARTAEGLIERAALLTRETGKTIWESQLDVAAGPYLLHVASRLADRLAEEHRVENARGTFVRRRQPKGVVAALVPWNAPVVLALNGIAPALLAGNTVVAKPSELAPLALSKTLAILADELPSGVINVCPGPGPTGQLLAEHPLVRHVLLTGGSAAGRAAMRAASTHLAGVTLELGGNDPAIILDSATITDELVGELRDAAFACSGQVCFAAKRLYVHVSRHDELLARLSEAIDEIVVGDGLDPESTMGPVIDDRALARLNDLAARTRAAGAIVRELGRPRQSDTLAGGSFMLPHLVEDVPHDAEIVAVEQFGPILPVVEFDREEDVIAMANDTEYGLSASVWSDDIEHAIEVGRGIESGTVFINVHRAGASDHHTPFGGIKASGVGRVNGWAGVEEVTETQMLIHRADAAALPRRPASQGRAQ